MAPQITSAIISSPTSSLNCIVDIPKPPSSVHTRPLKSSISNSTTNLLPPPLSSYPPPSIYPYRPSLPPTLSTRMTLSFGRGHFEDGSRDTIHWNHSTRPDTRLHLITSRYTLLHYSQPFPPDNIIDLEMRNVLKRCTRVGGAAWLLWKEIILLFRACAPQ